MGKLQYQFNKVHEKSGINRLDTTKYGYIPAENKIISETRVNVMKKTNVAYLAYKIIYFTYIIVYAM